MDSKFYVDSTSSPYVDLLYVDNKFYCVATLCLPRCHSMSTTRPTIYCKSYVDSTATPHVGLFYVDNKLCCVATLCLQHVLLLNSSPMWILLQVVVGFVYVDSKSYSILRALCAYFNFCVYLRISIVFELLMYQSGT